MRTPTTSPLPSQKIQQTWDRIQSQFQSLYIAEEAVGGVHENNRLGGEPLLDCVVLSRVTGVTCARNILGDRVTVTSLAVLANEGKAERSKSDQAIVVGGDWVDKSTDDTVSETMAAWCCWAIRRSMVALRAEMRSVLEFFATTTVMPWTLQKSMWPSCTLAIGSTSPT